MYDHHSYTCHLELLLVDVEKDTQINL